MSISASVGSLAIRTKILFSFTTLVLLLVGLGGSALQRSSAMNTTVQGITENYVLAVVYLDEMRVSAAGHSGIVMLELLQADDNIARQKH